MKPLHCTFSQTLSFCALCAATTHAALAETTAENAADAPVMVVTATRNAVDTMTAPAAVSVVDSKAIAEKPALQLSDAVKDVPGLLVRDNNGAPSAWSQQVIMRGVAGYTRNAVLLDGEPLNSSFSNGVNWSVVDPQAVERLEVVRGPFSSLYGGAAMGGVINIITKRPTKRETDVQVGYGTNSLALMRVAYADRLSERAGLRLDVSDKRSSGIIEDEVVKSSFRNGAGNVVTGIESTRTSTGNPAVRIGDKGHREWKQQNLGATVDLATSARSTLTLAARYHTHENGYDDFNTYLKDAAGNPVTSGNIAVDPTRYFTLKEGDFLFGANGEDVARLSAAYEHDLGDGARFRIDGFQSRNYYWYVTPGTTATNAGGVGKLVNIPNDRSAANGTYTFPLGESQLMVTGLSFTRDSLHKSEHNITDWREPDSSWSGSTTFRAVGENRTWAAFVQDEIAATPSVTLYAGLRYDSWTTRGDYAFSGTSTLANHFSARSKDAWSPKLSAVYTPSNAVTWRASVGDAFRAPTLSDMYSTWGMGSTIYYSNPNLKPETIRSWEIGTERRFEGNLRLSATLFHNEMRDMIASTAINDGTNNKIMSNIGKAESQGIELGLDYPFTAATRGFINYTVTETKVLKNAANPDSVGKRLTLVPRESANLGLQNTFGRLTTYVVGRYVGKMYGEATNLDKTNDVYGSYDPYFVIDTKLGYALHDSLTASLSVTNLLDRRYYQQTRAAERALFADVTARF